MSERLRWWLSLAGVLLWVGFPIVFALGRAAKRQHRCGGRTFTGEFDDCFNDYIPVLEVVFVPLIFLLSTYPFARFAYSLYAPDRPERTLRWRLAASEGAATYWPMLQLTAAVGLGWVVWCLWDFPLERQLWAFHAYWIAFGLWFATAIVVGRPRRSIAA